jgi:myo-inositol 2-dehydrogenase/D-chiro-inositol 1-dehydrogenase
MNFLILGDGPEELAWAIAIAARAEHRLIAAYPGFAQFESLPHCGDLEEALAIAGVEGVVVGGALETRAEALRRVAASGLPAICLHPPGADSEAYYQVAMSREETGAVLVPDLIDRLHPGVAALRQALERNEIGSYRSLGFESPADPAEGGLLAGFSRAVDLTRALLGEIEAVNATGDPPGEAPDQSLIVQLRAAGGRRAEVRLWPGLSQSEPAPARLALNGARASLTLELPTAAESLARLVKRTSDGSQSVTDLEPFDPRDALLDVLADALDGRACHPDLDDGTRAMELTEAVVRSLRRGRTIELFHEQISEEGIFTTVMTSVGCMLLLGAVFVLPLALVGPALGFPWTIYVAYAIPPILIVFILMQTLRFAARGKAGKVEQAGGQSRDER